MSEEFERGDETEEEFDETSIPFPRRQPPGQAIDLPVANADDLPLFPDAGKKQSRTVSYIAVIRQNGPNPGYKGNLKPGATELTVFQTFGNGMYTLEARTERHKLLRIRENVGISFNEDDNSSKSKEIVSANQGIGYTELHKLVNDILLSKKEESDRIQDLAKETSEQSRQQSKDYISLVKESTTQTVDRDREFFANMSKQSQDFMSGILQSSREGFQQMMILLQTGHEQTMEQLRAISDKERNDPMTMVSLLVEGLKMGREFEGDDRPEWVQALGEGSKMLSDLKDLAMLKAGKSTTIPTFKQLVAQTKENTSQEDRVVKKNPEIPVTRPESNKKLKILSRLEVEKLADLKKTLNERGIDLDQLLSDNIEHYRTASDKDIFGEDNPENSPDKSTGNEPDDTSNEGEESE